MVSPLQFGPAQPADAGRISWLIERSVRDTCIADHAEAPETLERWLRNCQAATIRQWIGDAGLVVRVVRRGQLLMAVGVALRSGEICQCHVLPGCRGEGIGRALVTDLEQCLQRLGLRRAMLYSSVSAGGFFRRLGYRADGAALVFHGLHLQLMEKTF